MVSGRHRITTLGCLKEESRFARGGAIELRIAASRGRAELNGAADRVTAFAGLAHRYPKAKLIFSGGSGSFLLQNDAQFRLVAEVWRGLSDTAKDRVMAIVENGSDSG